MNSLGDLVSAPLTAKFPRLSQNATCAWCSLCATPRAICSAFHVSTALITATSFIKFSKVRHPLLRFVVVLSEKERGSRGRNRRQRQISAPCFQGIVAIVAIRGLYTFVKSE
jgi:hypothetical protein